MEEEEEEENLILLHNGAVFSTPILTKNSAEQRLLYLDYFGIIFLVSLNH